MLIHIKNLGMQAIVGVNDWERTQAQQIFLNIDLEFAGQAAADSDDLNQAIDYASLSERIIQAVAGWRFFLLEKLASEILNLIMQDQRVLSARVEVIKPDAIKAAEFVSVTTSAERS